MADALTVTCRVLFKRFRAGDISRGHKNSTHSSRLDERHEIRGDRVLTAGQHTRRALSDDITTPDMWETNGPPCCNVLSACLRVH